jgi:hypothetical protein
MAQAEATQKQQLTTKWWRNLVDLINAQQAQNKIHIKAFALPHGSVLPSRRLTKKKLNSFLEATSVNS